MKNISQYSFIIKYCKYQLRRRKRNKNILQFIKLQLSFNLFYKLVMKALLLNHSRMRILVKSLGIIILYVSTCRQVQAQSEFTGAIQQYTAASNRLFVHEDVSIDWTMDGKLQVYLNEGINSLNEGNLSIADENFSQFIKSDSSTWQAYYYRGVTRKMQRKLLESRRDFERALNLHESVESTIELGKVFQIEGNFREAHKYYDRSIRMDPNHAVVFYLKGNLYTEQNQAVEAVKNFELCIQKDNHFSDARIRLGIIQIVQEKKTGAGLVHFNNVLQYDSLNNYALLLRSLINAEANIKQSIQDLSKLIRVSPDLLLAYYLRGLLLTKSGKYEQSFVDFHKVIQATYESDNSFIGQQTWLDKKIDLQNAGFYTISRVYGLNEGDESKIKKAYCLILTGEYGYAIQTINETTVSKSDPLCVFLKAVASEHLGNHQAALRFYNLALEMDNDIQDAHKKRGIYAQELKLWEQSIKDFNEVLRLNPDAYVMYKMRGTSYYYLNQFTKAIADYTHYLKKDTANIEIIGSRGMAYLNHGQYLDAYVDFANSNNLEMLNFTKVSHLIDSTLAKGDTLIALNYINNLTKKVPSFTEGYIIKFKILAKKQEWKNIETELVQATKNIRTDVKKEDESYLVTLQAIIFSRNNQKDEALKFFDTAIKLNNKNTEAYLERGKLLMLTGKNKQAIIDLKKASALGSSDATNLLSKISEN